MSTQDEDQTTTDGRPVAVVRAEQAADGDVLHRSYVVLTDEERARGFVRPLRLSYRHVGAPAPAELRELTPEESARYSEYGYVRFQPYHEPESPVTGRFWTQAGLDRVGKGCGRTTTMSVPIAETYARRPAFYGKTYCVHCRAHLNVGKDGEFVWDGTDERVGT